MVHFVLFVIDWNSQTLEISNFHNQSLLLQFIFNNNCIFDIFQKFIINKERTTHEVDTKFAFTACSIYCGTFTNPWLECIHINYLSFFWVSHIPRFSRNNWFMNFYLNRSQMKWFPFIKYNRSINYWKFDVSSFSLFFILSSSILYFIYNYIRITTNSNKMK